MSFNQESLMSQSSCTHTLVSVTVWPHLVIIFSLVVLIWSIKLSLTTLKHTVLTPIIHTLDPQENSNIGNMNVKMTISVSQGAMESGF